MGGGIKTSKMALSVVFVHVLVALGYSTANTHLSTRAQPSMQIMNPEYH